MTGRPRSHIVPTHILGVLGDRYDRDKSLSADALAQALGVSRPTLREVLAAAAAAVVRRGLTDGQGQGVEVPTRNTGALR